MPLLGSQHTEHFVLFSPQVICCIYFVVLTITYTRKMYILDIYGCDIGIFTILFQYMIPFDAKISISV